MSASYVHPKNSYGEMAEDKGLRTIVCVHTRMLRVHAWVYLVMLKFLKIKQLTVQSIYSYC